MEYHKIITISYFSPYNVSHDNTHIYVLHIKTCPKL